MTEFVVLVLSDYLIYVLFYFFSLVSIVGVIVALS